MDEQSSKESVFTIPLEYVLEQLEKVEEQVRVTQGLLSHFFDQESEDFKWLIPLATEILWSNFNIVKLLKPYVDDPVFFDNPDTGEKEYMISEVSLLNLQAMILHRHYANVDLNRCSYSTRLN
jgi:hypothetical protein